MRVLICGSRDWTDYEAIESLVKSFPKGTVIIQGECKGADLMAKKAGRIHGFKVLSYPARWKKHRNQAESKYSNPAGRIRNTEMLFHGKPDVVYAFPLPQSTGTVDLIRKARKRRIPVIIIESEESSGVAEPAILEEVPDNLLVYFMNNKKETEK